MTFAISFDAGTNWKDPPVLVGRPDLPEMLAGPEDLPEVQLQGEVQGQEAEEGPQEPGSREGQGKAQPNEV